MQNYFLLILNIHRLVPRFVLSLTVVQFVKGSLLSKIVCRSMIFNNKLKICLFFSENLKKKKGPKVV